MLQWLKNKLKAKIDLNNEVDIYYGQLKVATVPEKVLTGRVKWQDKKHICYQLLDFVHLCYLKDENNKPYQIDIQNIPYGDNQTPSEILFDEKTKQITEIVYSVTGIGYLVRSDYSKPVHIIIKNGKIEKEEYGKFMFNNNTYKEYNLYSGQELVGLNSYTLPSKIVYCKDGRIDQEQSGWIVSKPNDEQIIYTYREYKELLKPININVDNYKNFTDYEKKIIHMYLNYTIYEKELIELGIECSQESIVKNINLIEMYYI